MSSEAVQLEKQSGWRESGCHSTPRRGWTQRLLGRQLLQRKVRRRSRDRHVEGGGRSPPTHPTGTVRGHEVPGWWMVLVPHFLLEVLERFGVVASTHSFLPGFVLRRCIKSGQKVAPSFSSAELAHEAGTALSSQLPSFLRYLSGENKGTVPHPLRGGAHLF